VGVYETLKRLEGVEYVSERASEADWTCRVRLRNGGLPNVLLLEREIRESGQGATLRGVEATATGWLCEQDGELWLRDDRSGRLLRLAPLRRKVQWDVKGGREAVPERDELAAFARLRAAWRLASGRVTVTGPVVPAPVIGPDSLEVREFRW
jgi:hypothetical protein